MDWYADFVTEQFPKPMLGAVLDIGCNDGSQLDAFKRLGYMTFGIDPAENLHPISSAKHFHVWCDFFNKESADKMHHNFTVITTQNAFAHIPDPLTYLKLCKDLLRDEGKIFISTSQADMVLNGEFDTIYHEHISYYNAESMRRLAERAGLHLIDVVKTPIHGTSYIFILAKHPANEERMRNILAMEMLVGLQTPSTYTNWAAGVKELLVRLQDQINEYKQYYTIVGYGAAAKGMTLINASNIHLDCVIDDNPLKQGLYCPGTPIPVVGIDWLDTITDSKENIVFIPLAWNFYAEIKRKIQAKRNNPNDLFLRYFPKITTE
jgi:SAM-dependent methyltransferase